MIADKFDFDMSRQGIFGHSMGGHGALILALRNPKKYKSCSAFAPIVNPSKATWSSEAFTKYIQTRSKLMYPVGSGLKSLLDKILTDERWDLKLIGMQIIIEGLALAAFNTAKAVTPDPVLRDILHLIIRDEARHVTFGVNYLEDFIENLTDEEREDRAMFAYEACVISKERLFPTDVFRKFGWDEAEARDFSNKAGFATEFQRLLFSRVVPNLSRIGLLTDKVRPLYEELGVLEFESHTSDDISWAELEKPLDLTA